MTNAEPKNGFLVITVRNDSNETVELHTQEGVVCIQLQKWTDRKTRIKINAPRSIKVTRQVLKEDIPNGG